MSHLETYDFDTLYFQTMLIHKERINLKDTFHFGIRHNNRNTQHTTTERELL
jgi:hypothetical protein